MSDITPRPEGATPARCDICPTWATWSKGGARYCDEHAPVPVTMTLGQAKRVHRDLVHHPGTRPLTNVDLEAMRTRHANAIRPIPSGTVMGHEHLMADADRGSLLAEVRRLEDEIKVHVLTLGAVRRIVFEDAALSWEHRVKRLAQLLGPQDECPDEYCAGWKDSGTCPKGLKH